MRCMRRRINRLKIKAISKKQEKDRLDFKRRVLLNKTQRHLVAALEVIDWVAQDVDYNLWDGVFDTARTPKRYSHNVFRLRQYIRSGRAKQALKMVRYYSSALQPSRRPVHGVVVPEENKYGYSEFPRRPRRYTQMIDD